MPDSKRLIEVAFPLKQVSLDSVHEKNMRRGHISTLHIWPARRPLAACRAALIATLLPDPGDPEQRQKLLKRMAGVVNPKATQKKLAGGQSIGGLKDQTEGGILHWGRESDPDLDWFREQIRAAYGGRAPKVLDPFAGGGAIPLEAMRLGCEATAIDINPVAWFILKCTLEYPQRLAGKTWPLPGFWDQVPELAVKFASGTAPGDGMGSAGKKPTRRKSIPSVGIRRQALLVPEAQRQAPLFQDRANPDGDLADHVRAWGWWVLNEARQKLADHYPVIDGKPAVAYLWARTVTCKNCRATIPLLKTRWLCKKDKKRVLLTMTPQADGTGFQFGIENDVPVVGGNPAQRKAHDKQLGAGTMSKSGATCPSCPAGTIMTMEDIRVEGQAGRLGAVMTAVVVEEKKGKGKGYRLPVSEELGAAEAEGREIENVFSGIPFGVPNEPLPRAEALGFRVPLYGLDLWSKLFTPRQLLALGVFCRLIRETPVPEPHREEVDSFLTCLFDRLANQMSSLSRNNLRGGNIEGTFARFALPIVWDFAEVNPLSESSGSFSSAIEWVALVISHLLEACEKAPTPNCINASAKTENPGCFDLIVTDPPYYDAIPYSDLMDFFYLWLRRVFHGRNGETYRSFSNASGPKWDHSQGDGELIDDSSRFGGDSKLSKANYEEGMSQSFLKCAQALQEDGRLVIVFAHKHPDAWETLVSAIIRAGFTVDGSWPIQTERQARARSLGSAALSSSVWLVCRKRPEDARPGWDARVLEEMRSKIELRLREFWDAGIRGPDFVWAATGPALEAYSQHPVVKKTNEPGQLMTVPEFLRQVRRMVVDFVVGRVLTKDGAGSDSAGLDDVTTYYLLHRHDFGMELAPAGAVILYAVSCGLSDHELIDHLEILERSGKGGSGGASRGALKDDEEEESDEDDAGETAEEGSASQVRLRPWNKRRRKRLGEEGPGGRPVPMIDQIHRLLQLWREGEAAKVDDFINGQGLATQPLFAQVLQALVELAPAGSEERSLLESLANHLRAWGTSIQTRFSES